MEVTHTVKGTTCTRQEVHTLSNYLKKEQNHIKQFEPFRKCCSLMSEGCFLTNFSSVCSSEQRKGHLFWYIKLKLFSPIKSNAKELWWHLPAQLLPEWLAESGTEHSSSCALYLPDSSWRWPWILAETVC